MSPKERAEEFGKWYAELLEEEDGDLDKCGYRHVAFAAWCQGRAHGERAALASSPSQPAEPVSARLYYELIFAVESKFPNESRHETALRYIRQAEAERAPVAAAAPALVEGKK